MAQSPSLIISKGILSRIYCSSMPSEENFDMMKWEAFGRGKEWGGERVLSARCQNSSPFQTFFKGNTTFARSISLFGSFLQFPERALQSHQLFSAISVTLTLLLCRDLQNGESKFSIMFECVFMQDKRVEINLLQLPRQ